MSLTPTAPTIPAYVRVGIVARACGMSSDEMRAMLRAQGLHLVKSGRRNYRVSWDQLREILPGAAERVYDLYCPHS